LTINPDATVEPDESRDLPAAVGAFVAVSISEVRTGDLISIHISAARYDGLIVAERFRFATPSFHSLAQSGSKPGEKASLNAHIATSVVEEGDKLRSFLGGFPIVYSGGAATAEWLELLLGELPAAAVDFDDLVDLLHPEAAAVDLAASANKVGASPGSPENDSEFVGAVYQTLWEEFRLLQPDVAIEIIQRCQAMHWGSRPFFVQAGAASNFLGGVRLSTPGSDSPTDQRNDRRALRPLKSPRIVAESDVAATLVAACSVDGAGYEPRPEQVEMTEAVVQALEGEYHLLVEAGTGTGKSVAYLLPAAVRALRTGERVVVSTNTINLQEQLVQKDLPAVRELLQTYGPTGIRADVESLRWTALKGRRNYLCMQRFAAFRRTSLLTEAESRFIVRVLMWLSRGGGDRSGLRLSDEEDAIWNRLSAEGANCFAASSPFVRNGSCQLVRARFRAESAHLVVVNHSLLLSDASTDRHLLPAYDRLIVDEAHNLEDVATDQFGFHAGQREVAALLDTVAGRVRDRESGIVTEVRTATMSALSGDREYLESLLLDLTERVERARKLLPESFGIIASFAIQSGEADGEYDRRVLLTRGVRAQPDWSDGVEPAWENLGLALRQVEDGLERVAVAMADRLNDDSSDHEALLGTISGNQMSIRQVREHIDGVIYKHDDEHVAWLTVNRTGSGVTVASAPLNVGDTLNRRLFDPMSSVVLTSATLTSAGSFAYLRERLGLSEVEELALGYPFDYERAALLLVPSDMPDPTHSSYPSAVERAVIRLAGASDGRALVLFTSHAALRAVRQELIRSLAPRGIRVLVQGIDGTPKDLIADLRSNPRTVVCGTSSFWEGVDVVGEALSLLVITKLPFGVPSDPVFRARSELFDQPFMEYALPQAVLRFKQGFGRLIRHRADRGVVAVLDRRIRTKSYGRLFLKSLPPCSMREAKLEACERLVRDWLADRDVT
jgi:Rad3-related DNA helicase